MSDKTERIYVETISDSALDITEDIVHLSSAMSSISKLSNSYVDKERKYEILGLVSRLEKECRFYLRRIYLEGKPGKVYESLRRRIKLDLIKEGITFDD